jgi:membrane-anchored protein YejM (alkaline phosphatase superfamily)
MVNVTYRHDGANKAVNDEPREKSQFSVVSGLTAFVVAGCLIAPDRESFSMSLQMFHLSFLIILLLAMPLGYLCWRHWKKAQLNQDSWLWGDIKTSEKFMVNAILLSGRWIHVVSPCSFSLPS